MSECPANRLRVSGVLVGITLTLLALCLIPTNTRKLTVCLLRVFFHVQYGDYEAVGQPPGCVYYTVPSFCPRSSTRTRWEEQARTDPDRFIMAAAMKPAIRVAPRPGTFDGDPADQWAALRAANGVMTDIYNKPTTDEQLRRTLEFVEHTRRAHPENGALWLAEGTLYGRLGCDEIAMDMFREAARHPRWDCQPGTYRRAFDLLVRDGMLPLEAAIDAESVVTPVLSRVDYAARKRLDLMMADAIRNDDLLRFGEVVETVLVLQECEWTGLHAPNLMWIPFTHESEKAAFKRDGDWPPDDESAYSQCVPYELAAIAFRRYANDIVGPDVLNRFYPDRDATRAYTIKAFGVSQIDETNLWQNTIMSDGMGNLCLFEIAALCSACLLPFAFKWRTELFPKVATGFRLRWLRLIVLLPPCCWCFWNALWHRLQLIGLRDASAPQPPFLQVTIFVGLCVCLIYLLVFSVCRYRRGHVNVILLTASLFFGTVLICAHYRAELTENILSRARQPMTQENPPAPDLSQQA